MSNEDREAESLSLDRLSDAFAEMLDAGTTSAADQPGGDEERPPTEDDVSGADEACEISPGTILEAMLFVGTPDNQPLTSTHLAASMRGVEAAEIGELVRGLNERYAQDQCPYEIVSEGAGYRLTLQPKFGRLREKFRGRRRQATLSQAAIEVLAIVSYNQPITAEELSRRRGTASGAVLSQLVRRQLLRLERPEKKPRAAHYFTTDRFLSLFGLSSLEDLPRSQELDKQ